MRKVGLPLLNLIVRFEPPLIFGGNDVQTLCYVFMECNIVNGMENSDMFANSFTSVAQFFEWSILHDYLLAISKALKIEL